MWGIICIHSRRDPKRGRGVPVAGGVFISCRRIPVRLHAPQQALSVN